MAGNDLVWYIKDDCGIAVGSSTVNYEAEVECAMSVLSELRDWFVEDDTYDEDDCDQAKSSIDCYIAEIQDDPSLIEGSTDEEYFEIHGFRLFKGYIDITECKGL